MKFNRSFNIQRIIKRLMYTIAALFGGGIALQYFVKAMNGTCSILYNGLTILGIQVGTAYCTTTGASDANAITSPTVSTSILSIVGIFAIVGLVLSEFIRW